MAANLDQLPADGSQRVVVRPQKSTAVALGVVMGILSLIGATAFLVQGSPVAALICLGVGGVVAYAILGAYLWVDFERVGVRRFPWGASCAREQLARMQIVFVGRSRRSCAFVRKDGRTAFRVAAGLYGTTQLKALARSLGIPYDLFTGGSFDIQDIQSGP